MIKAHARSKPSPCGSNAQPAGRRSPSPYGQSPARSRRSPARTAVLGDRVGRYLFISSHAVYICRRAWPPARTRTRRAARQYTPLLGRKDTLRRRGADRSDLRAVQGGLRGRHHGQIRRAGDDRARGQGGRSLRLPGRADLLDPPGRRGWPRPARAAGTAGAGDRLA